MAQVYSTRTNKDGTMSVRGRNSDGEAVTAIVECDDMSQVTTDDCAAALDSKDGRKRVRVKEPQAREGSQDVKG